MKFFNLTAFIFFSLFASQIVSSKSDKPNIIFMLADDMGYGDLGCYGSPIVQSPNLDKLAGQGIKLELCYAASPNCSPARTGMLTGRSPYRVGMYDFARFKPLHIPEAETTVAELLKSAGYQTLFAGNGIAPEILIQVLNPIRVIMVSIIGLLTPKILAKTPKALYAMVKR